MKNFTKIIGTHSRGLCAIALAAIIGLSFTACGGGGGRAAPASDFSYALVDDSDRLSGLGYGYKDLSDGIKITSYSGNGGKVVIPATIEDMPVVLIGGYAFRGNRNKSESMPGSKITEVVIPEGVEAIYDFAFGDCENLTTVTLPASLKFIGLGGFGNCVELENLTIPDSASFTFGEYGFAAFMDSKKLPLKIRQRLIELGHNNF